MKKRKDDLKTNEWYYQYTKEDFLKLMKDHPFVEFSVDGVSRYLSSNTYRWNSRLEILEEKCFINDDLELGWREGTIESTVDLEEGFLIDFIVRTYCDD